MTFLTRLQQPDPLNKAEEDGDDSLYDFDDSDFDDLDLDDEDDEGNNNTDFLQLRIKSSKELIIAARPHDNVAQVKTAILKSLEKPSSSYVRLIAAGRLLAPDTAKLLEFAQIQDGAVVHAVVSHKRGAQAAAASSLSSSSSSATAGLSRRALRGTGIDASGWAVRRTAEDDDDDVDDDDESEDDDVETGQRRLGFDRLRDTIGFRRSEVASIRAYFNRSVDRWIRENPAAAEEAAVGESDLVRRRLLQEDAWMQAQSPSSEFRINLGSALTSSNSSANSEVHMWRSGSMGTDRDFMWGFMLGFFVGFLMLLWVWMPTVPHKQKLGILTGISVQLALGMLEAPQPDGVADELVLSDY